VEVQRELVARAVEVRRCYEHQLRRDPALRGRVLVTVRLSGRGVFEAARLSKDELGQPELASCILGYFSAPLSAQFDGDCAEVNIPLRFEPKKAAPSEAGDANAAPPPPPG
jgi:hypothetical protein